MDYLVRAHTHVVREDGIAHKDIRFKYLAHSALAAGWDIRRQSFPTVSEVDSPREGDWTGLKEGSQRENQIQTAALGDRDSNRKKQNKTT